MKWESRVLVGWARGWKWTAACRSWTLWVVKILIILFCCYGHIWVQLCFDVLFYSRIICRDQTWWETQALAGWDRSWKWIAACGRFISWVILFILAFVAVLWLSHALSVHAVMLGMQMSGQVGDAGASELGEGLKINSSLLRLYLVSDFVLICCCYVWVVCCLNFVVVW